MQISFFLDTNIFIYAHDPTDMIKTSKARSLIAKAHTSGSGVISDQVMREFCNVAATKFTTHMTTEDIIDAIKTELKPLLVTGANEVSQLYENALRIRDRYKLNFYDAAIIQAAIYLKCNIVYS